MAGESLFLIILRLTVVLQIFSNSPKIFICRPEFPIYESSSHFGALFTKWKHKWQQQFPGAAPREAAGGGGGGGRAVMVPDPALPREAGQSRGSWASKVLKGKPSARWWAQCPQGKTCPETTFSTPATWSQTDFMSLLKASFLAGRQGWEMVSAKDEGTGLRQRMARRVKADLFQLFSKVQNLFGNPCQLTPKHKTSAPDTAFHSEISLPWIDIISPKFFTSWRIPFWKKKNKIPFLPDNTMWLYTARAYKSVSPGLLQLIRAKFLCFWWDVISRALVTQVVVYFRILCRSESPLTVSCQEVSTGLTDHPNATCFLAEDLPAHRPWVVRWLSYVLKDSFLKSTRFLWEQKSPPTEEPGYHMQSHFVYHLWALPVSC